MELRRRSIAGHIDGEGDAEVVYEDEGFSGKNLDRPQFLGMSIHEKRGLLRRFLEQLEWTAVSFLAPTLLGMLACLVFASVARLF